jgi:lipopolysaccharide/colanic/teichoic acid biosynthesis glycosyltransferase
VRPGLSGLAQINGRNGLSWEEKFAFDVEYTRKVSFLLDIKIVALTVWKAFVKSEGISQEGEATMEEFTGTEKIGV